MEELKQIREALERLEELKNLDIESSDYMLRDAAFDELPVLQQALQALDKLEQRLQWKDIASAPRDGTQVLLYSANGFNYEGWPNSILDNNSNVVQAYWGETSVYSHRSKSYNGCGDGFILTGSDQDGEYNILSEVIGATHWMELPEAPE